jgi:uncharacterized protein (TIGR00255 family)
MIKSMTGFGKASGTFLNKKITVEIKSLNSKQLDLNLRLPGIYKEKELELRSFLGKEIERGRVDVFINTESAEDTADLSINKSLAMSYYQDLKELAEATGEKTDFLALIMRMPDVLKNERPQLQPEEWQQLMEISIQAIGAFNQFRKDEGVSLKKDIVNRIELILENLKQVETFDQDRINNTREKLLKNLNEFVEKGNIDNNRFEQELIYYLEKFDITEEKVRLKTHCDYFLKTMETEASEGRKLGFITQEIGREINTIGSKANHAEIQKRVVQMKDELEKIKEQMLNVL